VARVVGSRGVSFWRESGVKRSVLCWCVWQESGFSRREDVLTFSLLFKKFCKCCDLNVICKDNNAINYITFQHQKGLFPSTLTGHICLSANNISALRIITNKTCSYFLLHLSILRHKTNRHSSVFSVFTHTDVFTYNDTNVISVYLLCCSNVPQVFTWYNF
jgi:hypothetical protein